jgi:hypothetical protein
MARTMAGPVVAAMTLAGCGLVGGEDRPVTARGLDIGTSPGPPPATSAPEAEAFAAAGNVICDEELVAVRLGEVPTDMEATADFLTANRDALGRIVVRLRELPPPPGQEEPVTEAIDALAARRAAIDEVLVVVRAGDGDALVALSEEHQPDIAATKDKVDAVGLDRCWQEQR